MAENQEQIVQDLKIHLRGGQTVDVNFKAEKADVLNPQIEAFLKALGDKEKREGNFLFQGARVGVLIRKIIARNESCNRQFRCGKAVFRFRSDRPSGCIDQYGGSITRTNSLSTVLLSRDRLSRNVECL